MHESFVPLWNISVSNNGRFLQRNGSHVRTMLTARLGLSRDKVAHAICDAIKHDESIPQRFDFSGCHGEHQQLNQQFSANNR